MKNRLIQSTATVSILTMLSRLLGFVRDMVIAIVFGATGMTDAFVVAFRIPNMFRRMTGEGAFSQAFVPVFSEYREQKSEAETRHLVNNVSGTMTVVLAAITLLGILFAPVLISLFAVGFTDNPDQKHLAVQMLRLTFPYVLFISLVALSAGILNSHGKFSVPAFTPVLLNVSLIIAALLLAPRLSQPVMALAWGVLVAGIVQLLFQFPALIKLGMLPKPSFNWRDSGVRRIFKLMIPALVGSSAAQINLIINTTIASLLVSGSISWLYYSDRFVELPLAIIGVAIGTVILPRLALQHTNKSPQAFSATIDWAMRLNFLVVIPAMAGLIILGLPILSTLIQHGAFTAEDSRMSALSMATYALGLPAFAAVKILAPGFYSRQDTKTPVRIALISLAVNLLLNVLFLTPWIWFQMPAGHAILALSAAIAANVNAVMLYQKLRQQSYYVPDDRWKKYWPRVLFAVLVMVLVLFYLLPESSLWSGWLSGKRALVLFGLIAAGAGSYSLALLLTGMRPADLKLEKV